MIRLLFTTFKTSKMSHVTFLGCIQANGLELNLRAEKLIGKIDKLKG
jgi:hypothetical protein